MAAYWPEPGQRQRPPRAQRAARRAMRGRADGTCRESDRRGDRPLQPPKCRRGGPSPPLSQTGVAQPNLGMDAVQQKRGPGKNRGRTPHTLPINLVSSLVERSRALGVPRREYSLASKTLHWRMPWRVPVYDSFVRLSLGIPQAWDHPDAYQRVGELEPRSPLRAFDKCLCRFGG